MMSWGFMDVNVVNAFITGTESVISSVVGITPKRTKAHVLQSKYIKFEVATLISMSGGLRGNILYSMSIDSSLKIASKMMMMKVVQLDEMSKSAISELANMIAGNAATALSNFELVVDITPPSLMLAEEGEGEVEMPSAPILVIPFQVEYFSFDINISVVE